MLPIWQCRVIEPHKDTLEYFNKQKVCSLIKEFTTRIKEYIISQVLHEFGSAGNLEGHMYMGDVPKLSFSKLNTEKSLKLASNYDVN
ncbi:MAG: hypothetical protein ACUVRK_02260 [Spirochaetota bacterium]